MAKKRRVKKRKTAWRTSFFTVIIVEEEVKGKKLLRNGYVNYFESLDDAIEFKWRQLYRIVAQYKHIKRDCPAEYIEQLTEMEKVHGQRKNIS